MAVDWRSTIAECWLFCFRRLGAAEQLGLTVHFNEIICVLVVVWAVGCALWHAPCA